MTTDQLRTLLIFCAIMGFMFLCIPAATIAWDYYLKTTAPDGANTISWVVATLGFEHPAVAFTIGCLSGNFNGIFLIGLPLFHLFFGMPSPKLWAELVALRARVKDRAAES